MNNLTKTFLVIISILIITACNSQVLESKNQDDKTSIVEATEQKINESSLKDAIDWFEENTKSERYNINESELNALGYKILYEMNQPEVALRVFNKIIELFPESANAFDSIGEAYFVAENYDESIKNFRKSIALSDGAQFHQLGYVESKPYTPTLLPEDTTQLFVTEGNWENEIAFVYVQGGPDVHLNISPRDGLHLMPNEERLLKVYPYQGQMINPEILTCNPILTGEQSTFENAQNAEILDRVIRYLVGNKKQVFLIGHSFGASICMEYVNAKPNLAKKVVLMGLDLDEDVSSWDNLNPGEYIRWEDGITPYSRVVFGEIPEGHELKTAFDRVADNLTALVKNNMKKKYTDLLTDDDFKNLISVYSTNDHSNGVKSKAEIDLLKKKGATVVEVVGDHHDMLTSEFMTALYEHLVNGSKLENMYR